MLHPLLVESRRDVILRGAAVVGLFVCPALVSPVAAAPAGPNPSQTGALAKPTSADLSGRWLFNPKLSDDARVKMRDVMERGGGGRRVGPGMGGPGMGRVGRMGPPPDLESDEDRREAMRSLLNPAEEIEIFQGAPDIVLAEKHARRRIVHADGRKYKADNGASEVRTIWKERGLVIETRGFRGRRTTETWRLSEEGGRLTATVELESSFGPKVTLTRVYDRASQQGSEEDKEPSQP
jgi:hypothetical protein